MPYDVNTAGCASSVVSHDSDSPNKLAFEHVVAATLSILRITSRIKRYTRNGRERTMTRTENGKP